MTGPTLFLSLCPIELPALPENVRISQSDIDADTLARLCRTTQYQILWRGLAGHPIWHPSDGVFDDASAFELDLLDRQLELLSAAGVKADYSRLANPPVSQESLPPHWLSGGAHPVNLNSVKRSRPFAINDSIVLFEFEMKARKDLPIAIPVFHGNFGGDTHVTQLKVTDMIPVKVLSRRLVKLSR